MIVIMWSFVISKEGKSCLIHACEHGFDDLVEDLVKNGADVNIYDRVN